MIPPSLSGPMQDALVSIQRVAPSDLSVMILGEPGTGKEWAARLIHQLSTRARAPLHTVDCGAVGPACIERELFGYDAITWKKYRDQAKRVRGSIRRGLSFFMTLRQSPSRYSSDSRVPWNTSSSEGSGGQDPRGQRATYRHDEQVPGIGTPGGIAGGGHRIATRGDVHHAASPPRP